MFHPSGFDCVLSLHYTACMVDFEDLHRYDVVSPEVMRTRARALVDEFGANGAASRLGVSRATLASLLAGLPISRGSHSTIELQLLRAGEVEC